MSNKRVDDLRRFLTQSPNDPFINYALGIELKNDGNDLESLQFFEFLLREHPGYVPTYFHAGQLFEKVDNPTRAKEVYKKGIEMATAAGNSHAASEIRGALTMLEAVLG